MLAEALAAHLLLSGATWPAALALPFQPVAYNRTTRATSNWHWQAASRLDLQPEKYFAFAAGLHPKRLPRCIRLNNYWCIKKAGWVGEVASDSAGHVAFSTSLDGAIVAARLLRRYYVDYKRKSALAIVSRWAPAQCGLVARRRGGAVSRQIAPRGIHRTLRARFLARHGRGGVSRRVKRGSRARRTIRSRIRSRPVVMMRAPSISPGLGEVALPSLRLANLPPPARNTRRERTIPRIGCTSEALRIRNYASIISTGLAQNSKTDLNLFLADGSPGPNLAAVMRRMASVEIGPYKVNAALITQAIRLLKPLATKAAKQ